MTPSGLVHTHGPTNSRCPGSNKPHASSSQPQPPSVQYIRATTERSSVGRSASQSQSPTASSTRDSAARAFAAMHTTSVSSAGEQLSYQFSCTVPPQVKILKRITRASREQSYVVSDNDLAAWERV